MPEEHPHALPPKTRVRQYEVHRVLGTGGFGHTYLTWDHNLDRFVALKELFPPDFVIRNRDGITVSARSPKQVDDFSWARENFIREGRVLAALKHKAIVQVFDIYETNNTAYLPMEFIDGMTFESWLKTHGRPGEGKLREITLTVLEALALVHARGYMHRDLKPENILMNLQAQPVLIDFGNARVATGEKTTVMDSILTAGYAPLEQYQKKGRQGPATDLYALGAVLYRAIMGAAPEDAIQRVDTDTVVRLAKQNVPGYSRKFLAAIDRALQMKAADRWQNCKEWRDAIWEEAGGTTVSPGGGAGWAKPAAAVAGLALVGAAGWIFAHRPQPSEENHDATPAKIAVHSSTPTPTPVKGREITPERLPPEPAGAFTKDARQATAALPFRNSLGMDFVPVPIKGGPSEGHQVLFCIHETRKGDYRRFAEQTSSEGGNWESVTANNLDDKTGIKYSLPVSTGDNYPVVNVTIDQSRAFCRWLHTVESLSYRLPTDHEWSCAAGLQEDAQLPYSENAKKNEGVYPWGSSFSPTQAAVANFADESTKKELHMTELAVIAGYQDGYATTAPVKHFASNSFGLYDLGGNAWEYCETKDLLNANQWIVRGGSWRTYKKLSASYRASRSSRFADENLDDVGFRCVIDLSQ